jgi:hypothetical protein
MAEAAYHQGLGAKEGSMKVAIYTMIIGMGLPASSVAQGCVETVEPPTKLEAFMATEGAVVIRGSSRVGVVRGEPGSLVAVASQELTNARSAERVYGITVEVRKIGDPEQNQIAYVDFDEMPSLLGGLEYLAKVDKSATSLDQFTAEYRTKGDLVVSTTSGSTKVAVSTGAPGAATAVLEFGVFQEFRQLVQTAYDSLKAISGREK